MNLLEQKYRAPEIYGDHWFNSEPILLSANRGNVFLINIWDATDQNSIRLLPYLKEWFARYADYGLIIIGVHTPKFPFAKEPAFVQLSISRNEIKYPIVLDNDFHVWNLFRTRLLPSSYLIDKSGFIRYIQEGEASYLSFESAIQYLLTDAGYRGEFPEIMKPIREEDKHSGHCYKSTPEIFVGYQRGDIGNTEGYFPQSINYYHDPQYYLEGRVYLHGNWLVNKYFVKVENEIPGEAYMITLYQAKEVNVVIKPQGENNFKVFVHQDGNYLTKENAGYDVIIDDAGLSYLMIGSPKLYNVVKNAEFGEHILKLIPDSNSFEFYSMSFVSSPITEFISGR